MRYLYALAGIVGVIAILSQTAEAISNPTTAGTGVALAAAADGGVIVPAPGTCEVCFTNMSTVPFCTGLTSPACRTGIKICNAGACAGVSICRETRANIFYQTTGANLRADDGGVTVEQQGACW